MISFARKKVANSFVLLGMAMLVSAFDDISLKELCPLLIIALMAQSHPLHHQRQRLLINSSIFLLFFLFGFFNMLDLFRFILVYGSCLSVETLVCDVQRYFGYHRILLIFVFYLLVWCVIFKLAYGVFSTSTIS